MNSNPDLENLLKSFPGIEDSTSTVQLSRTPIAVDGKFSEIRKSTTVGENGIEDKTQIISRCFDCGDIADREGRNFGGICLNHHKRLPRHLRRQDIAAGLSGRGRPLHICQKHILYCPSCKKNPICIHCLKLKNGVPYCRTCYWLIFFGLKKEVVLCLNQIRRRS